MGGCNVSNGQDMLQLRAVPTSSGLVVCDSVGPSNTVQILEQSTDLRSWREWGRTHDQFVSFPLVPPGGNTAAFYRARARPKMADDDWKNQILAPQDAFLSGPAGEGGTGTRWVKFTIRLDQPDQVYFQDSAKFLFHHQFVVNRLPGFESLTPDAFDRISLLPTGQRLVLGAVVFPSDPTLREAAIQIVGKEPFPVQRVAAWLNQVRSTIALPSGWSMFYFPAFEQGALSPEDSLFLAGQGFPVSSPARWVRGDECYSPGWAYGRLKFVLAGQIAAAYAGGQLRHSDILLTDAVPAEVPMLAGIISLSPATPNSHVAILSQSSGIPFVFVSGEITREQLRGWDGQEVILLAERAGTISSVKTLNVQNLLTDGQKEKLIQSKQPPAFALAPFTLKGSLHVPVRDLTPQDIHFVGGKAANFGVLMRAIPDSAASNAIAFTFDLWSGFLDQVRPDGRTLRLVITDRLKSHTFPPDAAQLTKDLADIRSLIRDEADFSPSQQTAILAALIPFGTSIKIRFRSSTNVEDSEQFSGAGLYDSYSGCPLDDTDDDDVGPSRCDPSENDERGVFRALRRVYASFYNDNAFIERLRHRVDESSVGMAVLVHHSFPDETELANGVATLRVGSADAPELVPSAGELVTQAGAVSVSNPEGNARPEVVAFTQSTGGQPSFDVARQSSLVALGGTVLQWPDEYQKLFNLLTTASLEYARAKPGRTGFVLDFEYKKISPGRLILKQIREVPASPTATNPPPFVLNDAGRFVVFQHHGKDLYANHRLKSAWQFQALAFKDEAGGNGFDYFADVEYHDGAALRTASGRISSFPNASISIAGKTLEYRWTWPDGPLRGSYRLVSTFDQLLMNSRPVPLSAAVMVELSANYATPQVTFDHDGVVASVTTAKTRLVPLEKIIDKRWDRRFVAQRGRVTIEAAYTLAFLKFGVSGIGIFDGKSFPHVQWRGTTITGLTRQPIHLAGDFSQTYDSTRHNFEETFLFEPGLEAGLDPGILAELRAANIKAIRCSQFTAQEGTKPDIRLWGFDDRLRPLH